MITPELHLETLFVLEAARRIISTREPHANRGPLFFLVKSAARCAWAVRNDIPAEVADELNNLARSEPPLANLQDTPVHADHYTSLLQGRVKSGPAFIFPPTIAPPRDVVAVEDERLLGRHFQGWVVGEIAAGRAPVMAVVEDGYPVSVCFSARRSNIAAEGGVETAAEYRGRGLASRVTAAWALATRASGRIPLYSTDWSNEPSLAVARKLGLEPYAVDWSIEG